MLGLLAPTGAPLNVAGEAVDSTTLHVTWSAPEVDLQNGVITGYKLHYVQAADTHVDDGSVVVTVPATERLYVIRALKKWTQYRIWVKAYTRPGDGPPSVAIVAQTAEDCECRPDSFIYL